MFDCIVCSVQFAPPGEADSLLVPNPLFKSGVNELLLTLRVSLNQGACITRETYSI